MRRVIMLLALHCAVNCAVSAAPAPQPKTLPPLRANQVAGVWEMEGHGYREAIELRPGGACVHSGGWALYVGSWRIVGRRIEMSVTRTLEDDCEDDRERRPEAWAVEIDARGEGVTSWGRKVIRLRPWR